MYSEMYSVFINLVDINKKKDIHRFLSISLMSVKFTWDIPSVELDIFLQFFSSKELFNSIILVLFKVFHACFETGSTLNFIKLQIFYRRI